MQALKDWTEAGKNLFSLLRDFLLFLLLLMLIGFPDQLNTRLNRTGLTSIEAAGLHWEKQVEAAKKTSLAAAAAVDGTRAETAAIRARLDAAVASNKATASQVAPIREALARSDASLNVASDTLAASIASQQSTLREAHADTSVLSGWMYLGTLDPAQTRWKGPDQTTNLSWPVRAGAVARVDDDAYIRADGTGPTHAGATFLGVARTGANVRIDAVDVAPALPDGRRPVWARVTVL